MTTKHQFQTVEEALNELVAENPFNDCTSSYEQFEENKRAIHKQALTALREYIAESEGKVLVPKCFISLIKYAEWQMCEGEDHHPTLPSCVAECKAMINAAPKTPTVSGDE